MSESTRSPLARLVLFMICLSVVGTFIAGAHYYAVDLPQQKLVEPPNNDAYVDCYTGCIFMECDPTQFLCDRVRQSCYDECRRRYHW